MSDLTPLCPYCGRGQRYIERRDVVQSDPGRNHSLTMYQGRFGCVECGTYSPLARREYTEIAARKSAEEAAEWNRRAPSKEDKV